MEGVEERKSKFSSGLNIITRIDFLWRSCQECKRNGRYSDWNDELDTIWLELIRDIKPEDLEDKIVDKEVTEKGYDSQFNEFDIELSKYLPFMDSGTRFQRPTQAIIRNRNQQYKLLMQKQTFLAKLENKIGKGTSYKDDEDEWD